MLIRHKFAGGAAAAVLATGGLVAAGVGASAAPSAAFHPAKVSVAKTTHTRHWFCKLKTHGSEPRGCYFKFSKGSYKPSETASTHARVFKAGETVSVLLRCKGIKAESLPSLKANKAGQVVASFKVPSSVKAGKRCTLRYVGASSGTQLAQNFFVY